MYKLYSDSGNQSNLFVQFYSRPVVNEYESAKQQRTISELKDFVRIETPGNRLSIIDTIANEDHKNAYPTQWAAYKNREQQTVDQTGTSIDDWPRLNPSQVQELKSLKFYTVESIANASDAQLQHIGMIAGQSAFTFRDDAKRFLMVADAASKLKEAEEKEKRAQEELKLKEQEFAKKLEAMQEQMNKILEVATEKKRGRPSKAEEEQEAA